MLDTNRDSEFSDRNINNTKFLFLTESVVAEIQDAIEQKKHKGKLKGEWSRYIQNWEYYPNCNAVHFLCTNMQDSNLAFFTNRIQGLVEKYKFFCCNCSSRKLRDYFHLNKGEDTIRFTLKDDRIQSFIVHQWSGVRHAD